jgi:hypothetical protein
VEPVKSVFKFSMNTFIHKHACCSHPASHTHTGQQDFLVASPQLFEPCDDLANTSYVQSQQPRFCREEKKTLLSPIGWDIAIEPPLSRIVRLTNVKEVVNTHLGLIFSIGTLSSSTQ